MAKRSQSKSSSRKSKVHFDPAVRTRILRLALRQFGLHGHDGASIAAIAHEAQVSTALIFYYFENKLALWKEVTDWAMEPLRRQLQGIASSATDAASPFERQVSEYLEGFVEAAAANLDVMRLLIRESDSDSPRFRWLIERHIPVLHERLVQLIEQGQQTGQLKSSGSALHIAQLFIGACYHFLAGEDRLRTTYHINPALSEWRAEHARAVSNVLLFGMQAHPDQPRATASAAAISK